MKHKTCPQNGLDGVKDFAFQTKRFMLEPTMAKTRNILSVELIPSADEVLNTTAGRTGLAKKDLVARMCAWFASQDLEVQKVVLGEIPASMAEHAREIALRRMKGNTELEKAAELAIGEDIGPAPGPSRQGRSGKGRDPAKRG